MNSQQFQDWLLQSKSPTITFQQPLIMGIVNITPDSFSDGGDYFRPERALKHARQLISQGADILDIGGESTRPGATPVSTEEEIARVIPFIKRLCDETDCCLSVDTTKVSVMAAAIDAGAYLINDITALHDEKALSLVAKLQRPVCLMHMKGLPETMQELPIYYEDVIAEINDFFKNRIERCLRAGIKRENIILDPGFGFGKSVYHNLQIIKHLSAFKQHHLPVMLGVSRKSTIGIILNKEIKKRVIGGVAINVVANLKGVDIIRTHDVDETKQALHMLKAIMQADDSMEQALEDVGIN